MAKGIELPTAGSLMIVPRSFFKQLVLHEPLNVIQVVGYLLLKSSDNVKSVSYAELQRELGQCQTALQEAVRAGYIEVDGSNTQVYYRLRISKQTSAPTILLEPKLPTTTDPGKAFAIISDLIIEISREFGEDSNADLVANKSQIHHIWRQSKLDEQEMLNFMRSTRSITRNQFEMGGLRNPMSYYFRTLRNELNRTYPGLVDSGGRQRSRSGSGSTLSNTAATNTSKASTTAQPCYCAEQGKPIPDSGCPYQSQPKPSEGGTNW